MGGRARITDYTEGTKEINLNLAAKTHIKLANQVWNKSSLTNDEVGGSYASPEQMGPTHKLKPSHKVKDTHTHTHTHLPYYTLQYFMAMAITCCSMSINKCFIDTQPGPFIYILSLA